ncbi:MAG: hypothetical protein JW874_01265 [Spirochaetales bacterium]|nr:hypothetical protein [Spirochaetales bacterium]
MKPDIDNHIHSRYSSCCGEDYGLEQIIAVLQKKKMQYACVSDHIHVTGDTAGLREHFDWRKKVQKKEDLSFPVYIGAEMTIISTAGDIPELPYGGRYRPDFLIGGCHRIPGRKHLNMNSIDIAGQKLRAMPDSELRAVYAEHAEMICSSVKKRKYDILAHPFDFFFRCAIFDRRQLEEFVMICRLCREYDIAVGLNNASARRCLGQMRNVQAFNAHCIGSEEFFLSMLRIARSEHLLFSPGSDAHMLRDAGCLDFVEKAISCSGISKNELFCLAR